MKDSKEERMRICELPDVVFCALVVLPVDCEHSISMHLDEARLVQTNHLSFDGSDNCWGRIG